MDIGFGGRGDENTRKLDSDDGGTTLNIVKNTCTF